MKLFTVQQHFEAICHVELRDYLLENMNKSFSDFRVSNLESAIDAGCQWVFVRSIYAPKKKVISFYEEYYIINDIVQLNLH